MSIYAEKGKLSGFSLYYIHTDGNTPSETANVANLLRNKLEDYDVFQNPRTTDLIVAIHEEDTTDALIEDVLKDLQIDVVPSKERKSGDEIWIFGSFAIAVLVVAFEVAKIIW